MTTLRLLATATLTIFTLFSTIASAEEIKLSVASSAMENIFSKIKDPFEKETGIKLTFIQYKKGEATQYFKDVIDGKAEAAAASLAYNTWTDVMKESKIPVPADITQRVIGKDAINIAVNKNAKVSKLELDQVESLFTGKIKNWKEVGGADSPVVVISFASKPAKDAAFRKIALGDKPFGGTVVEAKGEESEVAKVMGQTPGAIGFFSNPVSDAGVQQVATPSIGRPTTLITKGQPSDRVQKLIQFIRTKGPTFGITQ